MADPESSVNDITRKYVEVVVKLGECGASVVNHELSNTDQVVLVTKNAM